MLHRRGGRWPPSSSPSKSVLYASRPPATPIVVHVSTELPGGLWMVEPRRRIANGSTEPLRLPEASTTVTLDGGHQTAAGAPGTRLGPPVDRRSRSRRPAALLARRGRPIRYPLRGAGLALAAYQTVFAAEPGSAEMPSASRPFTDAVVTSLVRRGVGLPRIGLPGVSFRGMNRAAFNHAVRAAGAVLGEDEILVIGSQAIHGSLSEHRSSRFGTG